MVKDEAGNSPPLTAVGKKHRVTFSQGRNRDGSRPTVIKPGKSYLAAVKIDVASLYELEADKRYALEIVYDDVSEPTPLKTTSKPVKFKIIEADDASEGKG